ncbi:DUF3667 domain-containing protein [Flavobacterium circumlabens]|uniref:DUF3667 domain-containing protein n=1 Tax=Flavobacterium circumlabens TaxID=2133765 RepID=A0A4Y7UBS1_9FLAO|nr:DUF3667 domain-containing protein [Flavobacterium circumlabens]TCN56232.1 uncharacterized protein DUF3667 [Flavobacterium circumlabens]TEB43279.1 DUF3667 domain-containing protein [Flavobacterium circumlabens]
MNCKNCNAEATQNYCPECGQPMSLKRIDRHYITHEIEHVLHFERGILYTIRELITRPGENIKQFLLENRSRLVKPIIFIIITSLIYSFVNHFFHIEDGYLKPDESSTSTVGVIFKWSQNHYGYANIIEGVFIAIWTKIFFRKYGYNFFEILILLCFVTGIGMLIFTVFALLEGLTKINLLQIATIASLAYCSWAIGQFFDKNKPMSYVKAFAAYLLGMITLVILAIVIGILIDTLIKH